MKIITVVGARPQFVKVAAISRAIAMDPTLDLEDILVHTGQHFDAGMSQVFFAELGIAAPKFNLGISGGSHGAMTARMLESIEIVLTREKPHWVLVYGDTNSTLAGALAASKLNIPIAHIEAGLRSFNRRMPEEINRIVTDHLSSLLFCPSNTSVANLGREGLSDNVHLVGDVMYDMALHFGYQTKAQSATLKRFDLVPKAYVLATCHRAENTDSMHNLAEIISGLAGIAKLKSVIFPIHPRTKAKLREYGLQDKLGNIKIVEPLSYLEMAALEKNAEVIITDSGGVQKEAFFFRVPCITLRNETEWTETVNDGWNCLVGSDQNQMIQAFINRGKQKRQNTCPYGTGNAAKRILDILLKAPLGKSKLALKTETARQSQAQPWPGRQTGVPST
ncbi:MAG TPA: UDP-N-acetylglucosamine 2-epimerase (non-hydrolyzing) [Paralcaligenes sp.]|jgi:UDP-N-acetylglucosamine 2-epimerase